MFVDTKKECVYKHLFSFYNKYILLPREKHGGENMGRPKGGTNKSWTAQQKFEIIKNIINDLKSLLKTIKKRGYTNLETIVHSDQGVIYTSKVFANTHKDYNIKRSMSRQGTPTDNPIIESLNGWIKEELANDFNLYSTNDIHKTIKDYIYYFNNERLAYSLNYKSPVQYRTELSFK